MTMCFLAAHGIRDTTLGTWARALLALGSSSMIEGGPVATVANGGFDDEPVR
jgi:hypothetical protein